MVDEHKRLTDEELREYERSIPALWDGDDAARLIAEVKRLRHPGHDRCDKCGEGMSLEQYCWHCVKGMEEEIAEYEQMRIATRTLTLQNGTVVRAGDVLVDCTTEGSKTMPIRVTAVGEKGWLALMYWLIDDKLKPYPGYEQGYAAEAHYHMPDEYQRYKDEGGYRDWKPWSEVYPDKPVPREEISE